MKYISRYLIFAVIVLVGTQLFARNPNLGTSGAQFLKIPISARAAGMGGAYVGVCQDATSVFWNPAGIAQSKTHSAHFSHTRWFDTFDVNAASYIYNGGSIGAFSVSMVYLGMDEMEVTTEFAPMGTGRFFDAMDLALGISYGRNLTDRFRVGLTARYIQQRIWNETANGISFDVGTQYQLPFRNLTIAMSMTNFGPDMRFDGPDLKVKYDEHPFFPNRLVPTRLETETYPLPLNFEFGLAMDLVKSPFAKAIVAIDAVHPNDNRERLHLGTEISFYDRIFFRGGYRLNHDDEQYNLGCGLTTFVSGVLMGIDYAYSVYEILPDVHRISFGISF
ncbi:MAG: PorV/PorQ family protein [candidate division KSB1 bacterium]|nr:PorV/PorQ family protein [candidate division KSB1 bacterium]MDZ7336377.1 PorV/PorQ family protein [candidate division KSB1 bacterium]MDZ7358737.1 PorV/PorQ family protein [candidate division KSB1 bacterium]MDZ7401980.1 PorV/PorQ family protein [candidate division KSB1 bacterium]